MAIFPSIRLILPKKSRYEEIDMAMAAVVESRNRYVNRSGFSAHQRVFGSSHRLPGSLMSDDPIDWLLIASGPRWS